VIQGLLIYIAAGFFIFHGFIVFAARSALL
jgi:hypothetical protein